MARTKPGLTDEQIAKLRTAVAGTRKPRVSLLDTQFGEDVTGQVVNMGDPATDGDEFITVRVKLGSVTDTLTFGPGELAIPARAGRSTRTATTPNPAPKAAAPVRTPASRTKRPTTGKRRQPAAVTITVSSAADGWKLAAMRGGRSLVKSSPLPPGVVTAIVDLLADQGLQHAVAEINDVTRSEAEERARQLRDELAAVESLLESHQRPSSKRTR